MTKTKPTVVIPNKEVNYLNTRSNRPSRRPQGLVEPVVQKTKRTKDRPHPGWDSDVLLHLLGIPEADHLRQRIMECKERRRPCGSALCSKCYAQHCAHARTRMFECVNAVEGAVKFMTIFGPPIGIGDEPPSEIAAKVVRWWNNEIRSLKRLFARSLPGVRFVVHLDLRVILRQHIQAGDTECAFVRRALSNWEEYEAVLAPHLHGLVILPYERHLRKARGVLKGRYEIKKQYELKDLKASQTRDEAVNKLAAYSTELSPIYYDKVGRYFTPESRVLDAEHLLILDAIQHQLPLGRWKREFGFEGVGVVNAASANPLKSNNNSVSERAHVRSTTSLSADAYGGSCETSLGASGRTAVGYSPRHRLPAPTLLRQNSGIIPLRIGINVRPAPSAWKGRSLSRVGDSESEVLDRLLTEPTKCRTG